jgi:hypothetical protein
MCNGRATLEIPIVTPVIDSINRRENRRHSSSSKAIAHLRLHQSEFGFSKAR